MSQPPSYEETTNNGKYQRLYQEEDGETYSDDNLGFLKKKLVGNLPLHESFQ